MTPKAKETASDNNVDNFSPKLNQGAGPSLREHVRIGMSPHTSFPKIVKTKIKNVKAVVAFGWSLVVIYLGNIGRRTLTGPRFISKRRQDLLRIRSIFSSPLLDKLERERLLTNQPLTRTVKPATRPISHRPMQ